MVLNPILGVYSAVLTYLCRVRAEEELGEGRMSMLLLGGCRRPVPTSWSRLTCSLLQTRFSHEVNLQ